MCRGTVPAVAYLLGAGTGPAPEKGTRMLTPDEAADVAARHRLTLADAQALSLLADDADHADRLAARFTADDIDAIVDRVRDRSPRQ